jgi:uncharacterized membrane protein
MRTSQILLNICNVLLVALVFHLASRLRKRNLYFGVTVEEAFRNTAEARAIARAFRVQVWTGAVVAIATLSLVHSPRITGSVVLLEAALGVAAWTFAWHRVRPHAATLSVERVVTLGDDPPRIPGGIAAVLLPFAGPAAAIWYLWSHYADLPARYPVHWNAAGEADRFVSKSPLSVFFTPIMTTSVLLLLAVMALAIQYGSRRGSSGERPGWSAEHRRLNLVLLVLIMWILSVLLSLAAFGPEIPAEVMRVATWSLVGLLLLVTGAFCVRMFNMSMQRTGGTDATPDECWRWGFIYYNPEDAALIVEKREGPGFTLNFGNRFSWAIVVLIVAIIILPLVANTRL